MAKTARKSKTKPFTPPPPAVKPGSEFSFAEYVGEPEDVTVTVEDDPFAVHGKDSFGADSIDWDTEFDFLAGKHHRISHARREAVEIALLEDPFATVQYEDLREDSELYNEHREGAEPPLTSLDRFERVATSLLGFTKLADPHRDRERDDIQLRIALYWLGRARKEGVFK